MIALHCLNVTFSIENQVQFCSEVYAKIKCIEFYVATLATAVISLISLLITYFRAPVSSIVSRVSQRVTTHCMQTACL